MKLKTRLIIAFFVIICVPLLLAGVSLVGFSTYQIRNLEDHLGISGVTYENMSDSVQVLNKATNSNFEQIKAKGSENPDAFLNRDYLDQLNDELKEKYSFLIVRKGDSLYYSGSDESVNKLFPELPEYSDVEGVRQADGSDVFRSDRRQCFCNHQPDDGASDKDSYKRYACFYRDHSDHDSRYADDVDLQWNQHSAEKA